MKGFARRSISRFRTAFQVSRVLLSHGKAYKAIVLIEDQMLNGVRCEIDIIAMMAESLMRGRTGNGAERYFSVQVGLIAGRWMYLSS